MRVLRDTYGFSPACFSEHDQVGSEAVVLMMEVNSWITGRRGVSLPFTDECAPLSPDPASFSRLLNVVSNHAVSRRWRYCEFRGGRSLLPAAPASISFWGHTLQLEPNSPARFSRVGASTRRAIRKAEHSNLVVDVSTKAQAVQTFHGLLCKTRRRHGLPPQPRRFFDNIHRHIVSKGKGVVVLAHCNDVPVAGALFLHFGRHAIYKFGASDESFQQLRGNNLVMWRAIEWHAERGYTSLDFGRTARNNDGLRRFKLSWGTTERAIEYFRLDQRSSRFVSSRDATRGWYNRMFRIMPETLSRFFGAVAYKHMA